MKKKRHHIVISGNRQGFSLIELLVVVGILGIIMFASYLALNPVELLKESRDGHRAAELITINRAIQIFEATGAGTLRGEPNRIYVSLSDPDAVAGARTNCGNLPLPPLAPPWEYRCVSREDLRNTEGAGWLPFDFASLPVRPLAVLPVDPVNRPELGLYYSYVANNDVVAALLESQKHLKRTALADGGTDPARLEIASDNSTWSSALGLAGFWKFEDQSGDTTTDASGNMRHGTSK